ncbi:nitrate reductase molybdenum cofactor assembly chaperone [Comamonas granuli]|uniref:nitrate reductase molybdenum cofactor assembly chaperone n=1 Tax=Comamonas granuli TaxID=290309 RepID=UPI0005A80237|nr:nitrate reductase molybdenum cofactor assembly chaperone [Comamonas granuli]
MFTTPPDCLRITLRALAHVLAYPDARVRALLPQLSAALATEQALRPARLAELQALCRQLAQGDPMEMEARYVETFDRGRATSLHLFEHVHGDSRDRGPALVDLAQTYERAGLHLSAQELPDHLPVVLEFASTQPAAVARSFLGEMAHILNAVFSALLARGNPYASVIAAILEVAGQQVQSVPLAPEPGIDESWDEPAAFEGCSQRGQARPDQPQPLHFVRNPRAPQGASV